MRSETEKGQLAHCSTVADAWAEFLRQRADHARQVGYGVDDPLSDRMATELESIANIMREIKDSPL